MHILQRLTVRNINGLFSFFFAIFCMEVYTYTDIYTYIVFVWRPFYTGVFFFLYEEDLLTSSSFISCDTESVQKALIWTLDQSTEWIVPQLGRNSKTWNTTKNMVKNQPTAKYTLYAFWRKIKSRCTIIMRYIRFIWLKNAGISPTYIRFISLKNAGISLPYITFISLKNVGLFTIIHIIIIDHGT